MTIEKAIKCITYNRNQLADARGSDYSGVEAIDTIINHACILSEEEAASLVAFLEHIKSVDTITMSAGMNMFVNITHAYEKMKESVDRGSKDE